MYLFIFASFTVQTSWTLGGKIAESEITWLIYQVLEYETVTGTCLNLTFSNKLVIDLWCSYSKLVNDISDHGIKCVLGSVVSTDKSECVVKFCFVYL